MIRERALPLKHNGLKMLKDIDQTYDSTQMSAEQSHDLRGTA